MDSEDKATLYEMHGQLNSLLGTTELFVESQKEINRALFTRSENHGTRLTVIETTGRTAGRIATILSAAFGAGFAELVNKLIH